MQYFQLLKINVEFRLKLFINVLISHVNYIQTQEILRFLTKFQ